ncbi:metallophosphoesterase [bacterium 3DAC]|jgi:hypothetical protein|nr:YmdB family metallophosphoesterase [Dictyoglomota bacterium]UZN23156.1 metallophosphoesterase [bacterium 3DAC]
MKILFFGDVVGSPGRKILKEAIAYFHSEVDVIVANGENAAHGYGLTPKVVEEMLDAGVDIITTGGHFYDRKEWRDVLEHYPQVVVPANYPERFDRGYYISSKGIAVMNVHGQVFVNIIFNHPFHTADKLIEHIRTEAGDIPILFDFHGEATSEKMAMGWYVDGRVSAIVGTHTHVPTADERILPGGTGYITDVGMCGCMDTVIGMDKEAAVKRFTTGIPERIEPPKKCGKLRAYGVLIEIDKEGKTTSMRRVVYEG